MSDLSSGNAEGAHTLERGPGGLRWWVNEHWWTFNDGLRYANIFIGEQLIASHRTSSQDPAPAACTDTLENPLYVRRRHRLRGGRRQRLAPTALH